MSMFFSRRTGATVSAESGAELTDNKGSVTGGGGGGDIESSATMTAPLLSSAPLSAGQIMNVNKSKPANDNDSKEQKVQAAASTIVSKTGLAVLVLLAVQNCSKNLLMRYVMKDRPNFLTSAAVLGSECIKCTLSTFYILFIMKRPFKSIWTFCFHADRRNTFLLAVPASAYNLQMSLEYVALANLDAAVFSVLVQTKLLFTATFAAFVLNKKLRYIQVISLVLLTTGVMLCNLSNINKGTDTGAQNNHFNSLDAATIKGILATLGIAVSSGFASVYTEKVIKASQLTSSSSTTTTSSSSSKQAAEGADAAATTGGTSSSAAANTSYKFLGGTADASEYGLAYTQVQLSVMSLITIGIYAIITDFQKIVEYGLFHNFTGSAFASVCSSAVGGLIVAAVLKYADSVLKGYATAVSVILTGVLSMLLFGTTLNTIYFMGIVNVVTAVLLYNGKDLDQTVVWWSPFGSGGGIHRGSGAGSSS